MVPDESIPLPVCLILLRACTFLLLNWHSVMTQRYEISQGKSVQDAPYRPTMVRRDQLEGAAPSARMHSWLKKL